jgi:hypothetical protein
VLDESGQIQLEQRVRTNAKALQEVFGAMPRSRIAVEIGTHSPWISRLLSELGHAVIVANARKVRLIGESRKKDDRLDAQTLARLARIDPELLYPVKHRSAQAQAQADLMMIRARPGLVRARGWSTRPADRKIVDDLHMHNPEWPQQQPRTNDCADEEACCDSVHHTTAVGCRANGMSNWLRHSQKPCSLHLSAMADFSPATHFTKIDRRISRHALPHFRA